VREQVAQRDPLVKLRQPTGRRHVEVVEDRHGDNRQIGLVDAADPRAVLRRHRLVRLEVRKARSLGLAIDPHDGADRARGDDRVSPHRFSRKPIGAARI
jgi:hypothetical protein